MQPLQLPTSLTHMQIRSYFLLYCDLITARCHGDEQPLFHQPLRSRPLPVTAQHLFMLAMSKSVGQGVGTEGAHGGPHTHPRGGASPVEG